MRMVSFISAARNTRYKATSTATWDETTTGGNPLAFGNPRVATIEFQIKGAKVYNSRKRKKFYRELYSVRANLRLGTTPNLISLSRSRSGESLYDEFEA